MSVGEPLLSSVSEDWWRVKPALEKLVRKNPNFNLRLEDVHDMIVEESAQLWVAPEGFVVTVFKTDADSQERTLFLWVAASFVGEERGCAQYIPFFEDVARFMNCKYIELWSSRPGMGRYLAGHGLKAFYTSYRKSVDG